MSISLEEKKRRHRESQRKYRENNPEKTRRQNCDRERTRNRKKQIWDNVLKCWRYRFSLKEAKRFGEDLYFESQPCSQGHITDRFVKGKKCLKCEKDKIARKEKSYSQNREAKKAREKYYRKYNSDTNYRLKKIFRAQLYQVISKSVLHHVEGQTRYVSYGPWELRERLYQSIFEFYRRFDDVDRWPDGPLPQSAEEALQSGEWHIDHIIPVKEFVDAIPEDATEEERLEKLREAFALENLRLLPAHLNLEKGAGRLPEDDS